MAKIGVENASAFMVHHVLNKNQHSNGTNIKKKRLKKNRKNLLKKKENNINKNKVATPKNNLEKTAKKLVKQTNVIQGTPATHNIKVKEQSPKSPKKSKSPVVENFSTPSKHEENFEKSFHEKRLINWLMSPIDVDEFMR